MKRTQYLLRSLAIAVTIIALTSMFTRAGSRATPQNGGMEACRIIPAGNVSLVASPMATVGSCGMPCFGFDPGAGNTMIMPNGNNLLALSWSTAPTSITTIFQSSCTGTLRSDNHNYTNITGSTGMNIPVIGAIDFPDDPLGNYNSYCGTGCSIALLASATGGTGVQVVKSASGDTAIQYIGMPHTTQIVP